METHIKLGRQERTEKINKVVEKLQDAESLVMNDYRGLSVSNISALRRELTPLGATLHIEKNKLIKIALSQEGFPDDLESVLKGPTAVAYVKGDISPVLKVLFKYNNDTALSFSVKGACVDGVFLDKASAKAVSTLPSRDQLIGQLMGVMNAPVRNLALGLNDVIVRAARALQAIADNKKE